MGSVPWPIARYPIVAEFDFAGTIADPNGHKEWREGEGSFDQPCFGKSNTDVQLLTSEAFGSFLPPFEKLRKGQGAMAEYANIAVSTGLSTPI